jgi:Lrp/AsnC ligand binding domain
MNEVSVIDHRLAAAAQYPVDIVARTAELRLCGRAEGELDELNGYDSRTSQAHPSDPLIRHNRPTAALWHQRLPCQKALQAFAPDAKASSPAIVEAIWLTRVSTTPGNWGLIAAARRETGLGGRHYDGHVGRVATVAKKIVEIEEVSEAYASAGKYALLPRASIEPPKDFATVVRRGIHQVSGVHETSMLSILSAFK